MFIHAYSAHQLACPCRFCHIRMEGPCCEGCLVKLQLLMHSGALQSQNALAWESAGCKCSNGA